MKKKVANTIDSSHITLVALLLSAYVIMQYLRNMTLTYKGQFPRLWNGTNSEDLSQQMFDWYSLTHVTHGILFFALFQFLGRGVWSLGVSLVLAVILEIVWEFTENTAWVINKYREDTISDGYHGDSIVNSLFDIISCIAGFMFAYHFPVWASIAYIVVSELFLLALIKDNLTLNIIMLLFSNKAIKEWQSS